MQFSIETKGFLSLQKFVWFKGQVLQIQRIGSRDLQLFFMFLESEVCVVNLFPGLVPNLDLYRSF